MGALHTPGPWRLGKQRKWRVAIDGEGWTDLARVVVRMEGGIEGVAVNSSDGEANAHLIAAAPCLLEALQGLEPYLDAIVCYASTQGEHEPNRLAVAARAAISRALPGGEGK